jgi:hypothetical protein
VFSATASPREITTRGLVAVLVTLLVVLSALAAEAQPPTQAASIPTAGLRKAIRIPAQLGPWSRETVLYKPFAPTSPWNTPIRPGARFTRTTTFAGDSGFMTSTKNSTPVWFTSPGDPVLTFSVVRPSRTTVFRIRGPAHLQPAIDDDLQLTLVDLANLQVWDFFEVVRTGQTTFRATAYGTGSLNGTGFGYFPAGGGARVRAGVRASGASWLGGLVTGENLAAGAIDHALAIGVSNDDLYPAFVPPAVEFDANGASTYRGTLAMGTRLGIPPATPMPPGLSPIGAMIFRALKTYGGYVIDRNAGFNLFADARTVPESVLIPVRRPGYGTTGSDLQRIVPLVQVVP